MICLEIGMSYIFAHIKKNSESYKENCGKPTIIPLPRETTVNFFRRTL